MAECPSITQTFQVRRLGPTPDGTCGDKRSDSARMHANLPAEISAEISVEVPAEIPVAMVYGGSTLAVMMASPANLTDFAIGFSLTEGIIKTADEITELTLHTHASGIEAQMWLSTDRDDQLSARRRFMAGPVGCGLCGIDSLDAAIRPLPQTIANTSFSVATILTATDRLRANQPLQDATRAVHAAGFVLANSHHPCLAREDIGRHNALDKLIGALARQGQDPAKGAIVLTSRVSVEMVQKSAMAGCGMIIAVSAPTAGALQLAQEAGISIIGKARDGRADIYTHPHRVLGDSDDA